MLAGCASVVDADQAQLCERVAQALHPDGTLISQPTFAPAGAGLSGVQMRYVWRAPAADSARPASLRCLFAAAGGEGRLDLTAVETARGALGESQLLILKRWWLEPDAGPAVRIQPAITLSAPSAYVLQQGLNAIGPAMLFAALATAFTLIHGLTGRIVLTIGAISVTAGAALLAITGAGQMSGTLSLAHIGLGIAAAVLAGAGWTWVIGDRVLWPLRGRQGGGQSVLIASLGVALVLSEAPGALQSGTLGWLPPLLHLPVPVAGTDAFVATTTPAHLAAALGTGAAVMATLVVMRVTGFGRAWRAMADDPLMAALCGVSPRAILAATCLLSGALCGLAGAMLVVTFGSVGVGLGLSLTLKGLAAAILGGVGSVAGAAVGGLLLGGLETVWSAAFDIAYRDVAIYGLLIVALVARPHGLFGPGSDAP